MLQYNKEETMYTKKEKLSIGKEAYDKDDSLVSVAKKYQTSYVNVYNWMKAYKKAMGIVKLDTATKYDNLNENQLKEELMRKDIEIARLKKGYVVKGGGGKKVYDITPD